MTKLNFLLALHKRLSGFPEEEVQERLHFYSEMIEDRMEEGLSEEEAVAAVGSVDEIAAQIAGDISPSQEKELCAKSKRRLKAWEIVLLVVGSPVWLSLLIAVFAVVISLYASLWCIAIALWAVFGSLIAGAFAGVVSGLGFAFSGNTLTGIAVLGAGSLCAGLAIFLFYGCRSATTGVILLAKKCIGKIVRKENA